MADTDVEYEDLLKTERAVKQQKGKNHYHVLFVRCCDTCHNVVYEQEEETKCSLLLREKWHVTAANVDALGLCDRYVCRVRRRTK